ncbi:hypothetical protein EMIHUDRAFT_225901 [Emiliania huxleyi CCMP1516]|uniref:Uncharacterized protein n=2 Tax=Emiliania huxleyi TaxID=2903 RepID=A0A0D3KN52_EMIH1|nr:hypothetical protein EMIHUDRAFT_225901 [Emiliania huxleyi CCMP1516]EOD37187.1 hypothetical protein EMIHUDRAFT_225901 [Emiliania huxleyi CCMP1516]|eukprot:XP_005789616.1 hypothetical protein EMIHUDRAFT_225901 [Emiliania huxleyi CCMP1516]
MIALENKVTMDDLSAAADHVLASFDEGLSEQTQRAMAGARVTACDDRAHADRSSEHAILRFSALRADECRRWVADATDNELTSVTSGMRELHGAWMAGEARSINLELNKQQHAEEEARGITRRRLTLLACESDFQVAAHDEQRKAAEKAAEAREAALRVEVVAAEERAAALCDAAREREVEEMTARLQELILSQKMASEEKLSGTVRKR